MLGEGALVQEITGVYNKRRGMGMRSITAKRRKGGGKE